MTKSIEHPCLSCPLPDCDDTSNRCALRKALSDYRRTRDKKKPVSDDLRQRFNVAWVELCSPAVYEKRIEMRAQKRLEARV